MTALVGLVAFLSIVPSARAAEIHLVYPRTASVADTFRYDLGVDSTFLFGNVDPQDANLTINGTEVELSKLGAFLAYLPLQQQDGTNSWVLALTSRGDTLAVLRFPYQFKGKIAPIAAPVPLDTVHYPRVIRVSQPNAHTRTMRGGSYELFPEQGTTFVALAYTGGFFDIELTEGRRGVIESRFAEITADTACRAIVLSDGRVTRLAEGGTLLQFRTSGLPVWTSSLSPDGRTLQVRLFHTLAAIDRIQYDLWDGTVRDVTWQQFEGELELEIRCERELQRGYSVIPAGDSLNIHIDDPYPKKDRRLRGKTIVLDAGHGGAASGALGPLGTREKDFALKLTFVAADLLEGAGAHVVMTRTEDVDLSLYERIDIAKSARADMFVSLHANALPDGANPFERRGTGTYYYTSASRRAAVTVHKHVLAATGLRDDGVFDANLAVVRPTEFPAILLEAAYLMHPEEEELLVSEEFSRRIAAAIVRGLTEYFKFGE